MTGLHFLLLAGFLSFHGAFFQVFAGPKFLLFLAAGTMAVIGLLRRGPLRGPGGSPWFWAVLLGALICGQAGSGLPWQSLPRLAFYAAALAVWVALLNAPEGRWKEALFGIAVLEAALALLQAADAPLPDLLTIEKGRRAAGTLGNPEFLSALLGVGVLLGWDFYRAARGPGKSGWLAGTAAVLAGLAVTRNKGTLLFFGGWAAWRFLEARMGRRRALLVLGAGALASVAAMGVFFPDSVRGRLLLWMTSLRVFLSHPWTGAGWGQVGNQYMDALAGLFQAHPFFSERWGGYAAKVLDAHNLVLQGAAEAGVLGAVAGGGLLWVGFRAGSRAGAAGAGLLLLVFKSTYTVVLGSAGGMTLALLTGRAAAGEGAPWMGRRALALKAVLAACLPLFAAGAAATWADVHYKAGLDALSAGNAPTARFLFHRALVRQPAHGDAWLGLGHASFLEGNREDMSRSLEKALLFERTIDTHKKAARMFFEAGLPERAEPLYAFLSAVYPEHLTPKAYLARIAWMRGDAAAAHAMALRVLDLEPRVKSDSYAHNKKAAAEIVNAAAAALLKESPRP